MAGLIDTIPTAKLLSFSTAFTLAGYNLSFSQNVLPAIYDHRPQFSALAFRQIYKSFYPLVPCLSLLSVSSSAYLAYVLPTEEKRQWQVAALTMFGSLSWTAWVMIPGTERLRAIAEKKEVTEKSEMNLEHRQLMIRWVKQNYVVVALQFVSAVLGLRAAMGS